MGVAGKSNASSIISGAIYLISAGSSDFVQNYYINPLLYKVYTADQFSDILIQCYASFIQACLSQPCSTKMCVLIKKIKVSEEKRNICFPLLKSFAGFSLQFKIPNMHLTEFIWTWGKEDWCDNISSSGLLASRHHSLWP